MNTRVRERRGRLAGLAQGYGVLILGALAGLYLAGIYGSEIVAGITGYDLSLWHEVFHDIRHAAGFMCH